MPRSVASRRHASRFLLVVCGLFGLVVGSFLNVVVWRVPRHESIVRPASHCPSCDTELGAIENMPVLSWVVLRGRCRHCGARISARYPLVELLTAGALGRPRPAVRRHLGAARPTWSSPPGSSRCRSSTSTTSCCPNRVLYPTGFLMAALFVVPAVVDGQGDDYLRAVLGGAAAFAVFFVIHVISPRGMGFGDVRLSFVLGFALGWLSWGTCTWGCSSGSCSARSWARCSSRSRLRTRKDHVPFGPFLAAGAMIAIYFGMQLLDLVALNCSVGSSARTRRSRPARAPGCSPPTVGSSARRYGAWDAPELLASAALRLGAASSGSTIPMQRARDGRATHAAEVSRRSLGSLMPATLNSRGPC